MNWIYLFLFLNIIFFTILFILIKEFERFFSFKKSNSEKYNIIISLLIIMSMFIWSTVDGSIVFYSYLSYFYLITFITFFNRKKYLIPLVLFTFSNFIILYSSDFWFNESTFLYLKLFEPIVIICLFWISNFASNKKYIYFLINYVIIFTSAIVSFFAYNNLADLENINILLYSFVMIFYFAFQFLLIYFLNQTYEKLVKEQEKVISHSSYFISPNFYLTNLKNYIYRTNTTIGAFINIKLPSNSNEELKLSYILDYLKEKISLYYEDVIYFQYDKESYNLFFKIDNINYASAIAGNASIIRFKEDIFYNLDNIANSIKNYDIKFIASFYGVETSDFSELYLKNEFLFNNETLIQFKNNVWIYHHKLFADYLESKSEVVNFLEKNNLLITTKSIFFKNQNYLLKDYEILSNDNNSNSDIYRNNISIQRFIISRILKEISSDKKSKYILPLIDLRWILENKSYVEERIEKYKVASDKIFIKIDLKNSKNLSLNRFEIIESLRNYFNLYLVGWNDDEQNIYSAYKDVILG